MNVEKNIRGRQRVLVTVWIWHIVLILYILFIYSNSMRPAVQSSTGSPAFAEAGSRYRNSRTMADRAYCAQMCSFY